MKKLMLVVTILLSVSLTFAQNEKKEKLTLQGDLIETVQFHDNGAIAQTGYYTKDGKLQGDWVSFDANGRKLAEAQYNNGKKVGIWKFYQGDTMKEVTYTDSRIAKVKTWESKDTRVVSYR